MTINELDDLDTDDAFDADEAAYFKGDAKAAPEPKAEPVAAEAGQQGQQTPAEKQGATDPEKGTEKRDRFVPYDAFHEERERRKSFEAELRATNEKLVRASERFEVLNQLLTPEQQKQGQAEMPDPEKDIFGAVKWLTERNRDLEAKMNGTERQFQEQTNEQRVVSAYQQDAQRFAKEEPSFFDAYAHIKKTRYQELQTLGYEHKDIEAAFVKDEKAIVENAIKKGLSPAKVVYDLAIARGYTKPAAQQTQTNAGDPSKTEAEKQLEVMQRAMSASQTLSGGGGSAPQGLTAQAVIDMDEDEFDEYYRKLSPKEQKKLLGG